MADESPEEEYRRLHRASSGRGFPDFGYPRGPNDEGRLDGGFGFPDFGHPLPPRLVLPGLLLRAVVLPGEKTHEGILIEGVGVAWREIVRLFARDPEEVFRVPPRKWEEIIAGAYHADGWEVTLTPQSGDHGRDVIAVKRGRGALRFIEQVKAYKPGHLVDANDVRALIGVLSTDHAATKGIVTTTSGFAPRIAEDPFIKPHIPYRLELVDGAELIRRLQDLVDESGA